MDVDENQIQKLSTMFQRISGASSRSELVLKCHSKIESTLLACNLAPALSGASTAGLQLACQRWTAARSYRFYLFGPLSFELIEEVAKLVKIEKDSLKNYIEKIVSRRGVEWGKVMESGE
ncbi:hypothetical protein Fot_06241 [Forsythia ovata]|uniref:Uncharacterized protein n=1 Tax=Forsythia ovata TaxID=205694 RepID=A0ABD1WSE8_9LAMI